MRQFQVDPPPESVGTEIAGELVWDLYEFPLQEYVCHLALAENGVRTYLVFLISSQDESDPLYEELFLPILEATVSMD